MKLNLMSIAALAVAGLAVAAYMKRGTSTGTASTPTTSVFGMATTQSDNADAARQAAWADLSNAWGSDPNAWL